MANQEQLDILKQGVETWNLWRIEHPEIRPDLSKADLEEANLSGANLSRTNLEEANLFKANLASTNLSGASLYKSTLTNATLKRAKLSNTSLPYAHLGFANLSHADLRNANLGGTHLSHANFTYADLAYANLGYINASNTNFSYANLVGTRLVHASLVGTNLSNTILTGSWIYGISAWDVKLEGDVQFNLDITPFDVNITPFNQPTITVDNLEVAQFIYLLLNNSKIRDVMDAITSKVVLILGRFTPERKAILDAIRDELRKRNYLPVLFDFQKPASRDITEAISTLAHMARFVIADLTDAKSIPQELKTIVPNLPSVPIQPLLLISQREYGMFEHFTRFPWVLPIYHYTDEKSLLHSLKENIILPAEQKVKELEKH